MRILLALLIYLLAPSAYSQDRPKHHNRANEHMHQRSMEELTQRFDDPARDAWQKPQQVIALLGKVKGKTVVDIGAGTGYFAFRLANQGARVIAADVDEDFQNFIAEKKKELGYTDAQVRLKKIPYDSPALTKKSAHVVIIVNTYHHIEQRVAYFKEVHQGLRKRGELMVVDFKKKEFDQAPGPPLEMRLSQQEVIDELKASGFQEFEVNSQLLPYQYIIRAFK